MRRHHGRAPSPYAGRTAAPPSAEVTLVRNFDHKINPTRPVRQSPLATSQIQGMPLDLIERVRCFPLFQNAPENFLTEIGMVLKPQMHAPSEYIMTEGEDAKAMYWIVRGAVAITSRDGESTFAELKPGAMVGEIGILLDRPRTATAVARTRCLTLQLKKEDLRRILPSYPEVERAIREEALERLSILDKKKKQRLSVQTLIERRGSKRPLEAVSEEMELDDGTGMDSVPSKRRKSPSPGIGDASIASPLSSGMVNVRALLKELPLFSNLPTTMLHFLGLNAQPRTFPPFTDIIKQDTTGREVFFIVRGEVEVLDERVSGGYVGNKTKTNGVVHPPQVKARLKGGHYFGEVVSLSLADHRTATVRSVTQVECLVITENVLNEFWRRCPANVKEHIAETAKRRLEIASSSDVYMQDADSTPDIEELVIGDDNRNRTIKQQPSRVVFKDAEISRLHEPNQTDPPPELKPLDPDPFRSVGLENVRLRSRRSSLAPPPPDEPLQTQLSRRSPMSSPGSSPSPSGPPSRSSRSGESSPAVDSKPMLSFSDPFTLTGKFRRRPQSAFGQNLGTIPDQILPLIFKELELHELMLLQAVSIHWQNTLTKSPLLFHTLDLSLYNRRITDSVVINHICPFVGPRPRVIDISNCFHLTDEGFSALATTCGSNVQIWRMKSVWEVTAPVILDMSNRAKGLVEIDLSNCRKVSDTLLARIVGWVVPNHPMTHGNSFPGFSAKAMHKRNRPAGENQRRLSSLSTGSATGNPQTQPGQANGVVSPPAPGTVFGCPELRSITLSYCKHITDRTMHHIATHAASRVEVMDFTRCTTITDMGFQYWGNVRFERLKKLCLADCTYLSDQAIVWLVNGAGQALRELDLSFCCALSDTSTEVLALGCPNLTSLDLSFCGSAVSDSSLRSIGHHLSMLEFLAVRGCVRVTGVGVESVVEGCVRLRDFDVSQCKNLIPWIDMGGVSRVRQRGRRVRFEMVK